MGTHLIFDFNQQANINNWVIVNDVVMGGRSSSTFKLSEEGHGVFEGHVSLANNGGFCSVRYLMKSIAVEGYSKVRLRLKGDGKNYQFRVKANERDYYAYVQNFATSGEWQEVEIALHEMYPTFRGINLNMPNFSNDSIAEIRILIGNKKNQDFRLLIDRIVLE